MDRGSGFRVWMPLVMGLCALYYVFIVGPGPRDALRWVGLAMSLAGLAGVVIARYTLGRSFSVRPRATELVTTGIYSRIRNPIYVFGAIFMVGLIVIVRKPALFLILLIVVPLQVFRARREARVLEDKFGDAYRRYCARTWL